MKKAQTGLGRGLDALFGEVDIEEVNKISKAQKAETVVDLKIDEIEPMLNQPRKVFNKLKLEELAASIKEHGVIQPILVVKDEKGYTIVAGERRWRAAKLVGLKKIPAILKDYTDSKKKQVALIENIQREDLNIMEIAEALKELMNIEEYSISDVAKVTGKNNSTVSNILRLLKLSNNIQDLVLEGKLVEGQARALLAVEDEEEQLKIANKIIEKNLTVREVERLIYGEKNYSVKKKKPNSKTIIYKKIEEKLSEYFGYKVKVEGTKKEPKIVINYYNDEGLESILQKLKIKL